MVISDNMDHWLLSLSKNSKYSILPYCNETKLSSHTAMALSTTNYQITKC